MAPPPSVGAALRLAVGGRGARAAGGEDQLVQQVRDRLRIPRGGAPGRGRGEASSVLHHGVGAVTRMQQLAQAQGERKAAPPTIRGLERFRVSLERFWECFLATPLCAIMHAVHNGLCSRRA